MANPRPHNASTDVHGFCRGHIVNTLFYTYLMRTLAALLLAGLFPCDVFAATTRWEVLPDRERLTITLNKEEGFAGDVSRVAPMGLLLELGVPTAGMGRDIAPENTRFFKWTEPRGRALGIFMKTAAFDHVVTRPNRNTVVINAFADPRGELWTPETSKMLQHPTPPAPATAATETEEKTVATAPQAASPAADGQNAPDETRGPDDASAVRDSVIRGKIEDESQKTPPAPVAETPEPVKQAPGQPAPQRPSGVASASRPEAAPAGDLSVFRSRINPGGPSDWQDMVEGLIEPQEPTPQPEEAPVVAAEVEPKVEEAPPAKIYVDAEGNPVPPPPDPVEAIAEAKKDAATGNYAAALEKAKPLLSHPELTREQMEEILHLYAEMIFMANQDKLAENFDAITSAAITAMNYNQNSPRNAAIYLRLGYINLKVGNEVEADAYFSRLRRQYPLDENIALTYYYWGEHYYSRNEMQKAADEFQYIISNFSENKYARDAALGLARSYVALGYYQEAFDIVDYIERRWPRLYFESPPVLELMGDVAYRQGDLDFALNKYMVYYNLLPNGPNADVILTRIGDVHARKRQLSAAKAAYMRAEQLFPEKDGGLVAMMRLAEVGINDSPEIQTMFSVFQGPFTLRPVEIYNRIIRNHPDSELVPLAELKLAMWHLWNKQYEECLTLCTDIAKRFPNHELAPRAQEVAMKAFSALAAEGASKDRSGQVVKTWAENDIIRDQHESLSPESRVALAASMWKLSDPDGALGMIGPMFLGHKDHEHAEEALLLALTINLEHDQWDSVERLAEQVQRWELSDRVQQQLDYALAISRENQDKSREAAPIWARLAAKGGLPEKQQAYVEYFLAKDAEAERRLQDAHLLGKSSLNRFLAMGQANPQQIDEGKINSLLASLMDISETAGRLEEALEYAHKYMDRLPADDSQRQGLLFRIAGIYKKQGNTPEWRKTLTELANNYPGTVYGRTAASALTSSKLTDDAARFAPGGQL